VFYNTIFISSALLSDAGIAINCTARSIVSFYHEKWLFACSIFPPENACEYRTSALFHSFPIFCIFNVLVSRSTNKITEAFILGRSTSETLKCKEIPIFHVTTRILHSNYWKFYSKISLLQQQIQISIIFLILIAHSLHNKALKSLVLIKSLFQFILIYL
jgi:hypothetical protein